LIRYETWVWKGNGESGGSAAPSFLYARVARTNTKLVIKHILNWVGGRNGAMLRRSREARSPVTPVVPKDRFGGVDAP
jgi:hypothetical protein